MKCSQCGNSSPFSTGSFCSNCGALLSGDTNPTPESKTATQEFFSENTPAWESELFRTAPLAALYKTFVAVLFYPSKFYQAAVTTPSSLFPALWYGLICGSLGITGSWLWSAVLRKFGAASSGYPTLFGTGDISPATLLSAPLMLFLQFFLLALYTSLIIRFTRCKKPTLVEIIRILCYAESASVLTLLPGIGYYLALITGIYSVITGYSHLLGIGRKKICILLIIPFVVFISSILLLLAAGLIGGAVAGAGFIQQWLPLFR